MEKWKTLWVKMRTMERYSYSFISTAGIKCCFPPPEPPLHAIFVISISLKYCRVSIACDMSNIRSPIIVRPRMQLEMLSDGSVRKLDDPETSHSPNARCSNKVQRSVFTVLMARSSPFALNSSAVPSSDILDV